MARAAKDLDLAALQELVGTDGQMAVEISRNVSVVPGHDDYEHVATWTIGQDDINSGALYENVRKFAGGSDGTGAFRFKATKPGVRAKPVEWEMRLPGSPKAPAHVVAEDAAKRQQAQATGQATWPPAPGQMQPGAPVSSMPVGGVSQGYGAPGFNMPGFMPMMGPWGMGMPPFGYGFGPMPGSPVSPPQPAGPLGELGVLLKPLIERMVQTPEAGAPRRDPEIDKLREDAQKAREEQAKRDADWQRRFDAAEAARREDKIAADAKLAEERAKSEAAAARAETDRRFAEAKAEADRRHETLLAELKAAREEGGGKSKADTTIETFKLMFQQQQASATEQREVLMKMLESAQNQDPYPDWMVAMFREKANPAALEAMTGAYSRLFEMTSHLTQAQIASIIEQTGDKQSPVATALMGVMNKIAEIGQTAMQRRDEAQQHAQFAGAQQQPAPRTLPPANGTNGAKPETASVSRPAAPTSDFGALAEPIDNLRTAQIKGLPAPEAAQRIVEILDFGDGFMLKGAAPLIALAEKDPAALIAQVLPGAPTDYQAEVVKAMKAILAAGPAKGAEAPPPPTAKAETPAEN